MQQPLLYSKKPKIYKNKTIYTYKNRNKNVIKRLVIIKKLDSIYTKIYLQKGCDILEFENSFYDDFVYSSHQYIIGGFNNAYYVISYFLKHSNFEEYTRYDLEQLLEYIKRYR